MTSKAPETRVTGLQQVNKRVNVNLSNGSSYGSSLSLSDLLNRIVPERRPLVSVRVLTCKPVFEVQGIKRVCVGAPIKKIYQGNGAHYLKTQCGPQVI